MSLTKIKLIAFVAVAVGCALFTSRAFSAEKGETQPAPNTDRLTDASFPAIFGTLQPPRNELWKSIPWHISLIEAVRQADKEGKPVFMFESNGWLMGCG